MKAKIIAHRGGSKKNENTLAAILNAYQRGIRAVEYDVRKTSDNNLILSHDENMQRISGLPHKINTITEDFFYSQLN